MRQRRWVVALGIGLFATVAGAPAAERLPIPTDAQRTEATALVHRVYAKQLVARDSAQRRALARQLLEQAAQTTDLPAARYVMLTEAGQLAAAAGDAPTAARAADRLAEWYDVSGLALKVKWLSDAAGGAVGEDVEPAALCCLDAVEQAVEADAYADATRLVALAEGLAQRARAMPLLGQVRQWRDELAALAAGRDACAQAQVARATAPDDPAASATVGRFLCLVKGDWEQGLPLLAAGDDAPLAAAAQRDLSKPATPEDQAAAGHLWWELAENRGRVMTRRLRERAGAWYRQARPALSGLSGTLVAQRLAQLDDDLLKRLRLRRGLAAELYEGSAFDVLVGRRVDARIDFDFGENAPAQGMPRDDFSIRWSGFLRIADAGEYAFVVIANSSAKLSIDGQALVDEPDLTRKRAGVKASVKLDEGMHPIRLDFADRSGLAKVRLLWIPPGESRPVPVPAETFVHAP